MRLAKTLLLLGALFCAPLAAQAALNNDPSLPAPAPILDAGWASDSINLANTDSSDSPYAYNLPNPAVFRITDDFLLNDEYKVYDFGNLILTTALNTPPIRLPFGDNASADAAWVAPVYQHGEVLLGAGAHLLTVQGDGAGGLPAGFWTRIDSVPEPSTVVLAALGLVSMGVVGYRRRTRNA